MTPTDIHGADRGAAAKLRRVFVALAMAMAMAAGTANAQSTVAALQATDAVSRGLVAQYQAALIRERRLADDREQRLIADYETRMRGLRARVDRGDAAAQSQLGEARLQYAAYVAPIAGRDGDARQLVESYQMQLARDIAQASPEQLAALQRFADGDQEAGFTQYQAESARRAAARQNQIEAATQAARAADAADARQLASLGETMRLSGRKTIAEVIALYESACSLDPSVAAPWLALAQLYINANRTDASREAADRGLAANASLLERVQLQLARGDALTALGRYAEARAVREAARDSARQRADADRQDWEAQRLLAVSLERVADSAGGLGELEVERRANEESVAILRRLIATDPGNVSLRRDLITFLVDAANDSETARNYAYESVRIARDLVSASPSNADFQGVLGDALYSAARQQQSTASVLEYLQESLAIRRRLAASDPSNAQAQDLVAGTIFAIGVMQKSQRDFANARTRFEEALTIERRLAAADPNNASVAETIADMLGAMGEIQIEQDDNAGALASYQESVAIYRRTFGAEQGNVWILRRFADHLVMLGDLQRHMGDTTGARSSYEEGLAIYRRIAAVDPQQERAMWIGMRRMVMYVPDGGVTWGDVLRVLEDLESRGRLAESDLWALEEARERAAQ